MASRIAAALRTHAWLVAEDGGRVIGYAYGGPYKSRPAYRWSCLRPGRLRVCSHGTRTPAAVRQPTLAAHRHPRGCPPGYGWVSSTLQYWVAARASRRSAVTRVNWRASASAT
jgi:hypothetical protein